MRWETIVQVQRRQAKRKQTVTPAGRRLRAMYRFHTRGWTLIELMVVVAIVGILAAVAYPSYTEYVRKGRRADAVAALGAVQQAQERYRSNHPSYGTMAEIGAPSTTAHGHYTVAVTGTPTASTYSAVATPIGAQASDSTCTTLNVSMANGNIVYGKTGSGTVASCWGY